MVESKRRWVLTGTPEERLYGPLAALNIHPFGDWLFYHARITSSVGSHSYLTGLLASCMLRRSMSVNDVVVPCTEEVHKVQMTQEEAQAYQAMRAHCLFISGRVDVLRAVAPLHRFCSGGKFERHLLYVVPQDVHDQHVAEMQRGSAAGYAVDSEIAAACEEMCAICLTDPCTVPARTVCGHWFCSVCLLPWVSVHHSCPMCRGSINGRGQVTLSAPPQAPAPTPGDVAARDSAREMRLAFDQGEETRRDAVNAALDALEGTAPSKISEAVQLVSGWLQQESTGGVLVFSKFDAVLAELAKALPGPVAAHRVNNTAAQRVREVARFQAGEARVLLLPLNHSNQGINMTAASHVLIMEPAWNVALEKQAIGRAMRLGQKRPVLVTRLMCEGTAEEVVFDGRGAGGGARGTTGVEAYRAHLRGTFSTTTLT